MKSVYVMRCKVVKEREFEYGSVSSASEAVTILRGLMDGASEEYFWLLCMDTKGKVVGVHEVSHGDLNSAPVHPREVFKRALLNNASSIIVSHNHPSGDPTPSDCDRILTERLVEAGKLIGIAVLDHIILGDDIYHSFAGSNEL